MTQPIDNKVLLVDDNLFFLTILKQELDKNGLNCLVAESAKEALNILKTDKPDIILSDYEMPEMNGIEFRKHLLLQPELKDIPFVFLTYQDNKQLIAEGLGLKAIDYIVKDTPIEVISKKLNNILTTVSTQRNLSVLEIKKAAQSLNIKSIPTKPPETAGFDIDFWHRAYHDIPGGDFIDFISVNDRYTFVVLGDIMGKKWMAWYFTFGFLSYIRSAVRFASLSGDFSPGSILKKVNSIICLDDVLQDILSTLSLVLIDSETNRISYSGAGDLPLLHYDTKNQELIQIKSEGLLLGMFASTDYADQQIILNPNDQLFIFTDGMIDFEIDGVKKTDYSQFKDNLHQYITKGTPFNTLKKSLFTEILNKQVDDCSIINIHKS